MFDKLEDILIRLVEIINELNEPNVAGDTNRFQKLMKEQAELQPIADAYNEYKRCNETVEESLMMLEDEKDEEGNIIASSRKTYAFVEEDKLILE